MLQSTEHLSLIFFLPLSLSVCQCHCQYYFQNKNFFSKKMNRVFVGMVVMMAMASMTTTTAVASAYELIPVCAKPLCNTTCVYPSAAWCLLPTCIIDCPGNQTLPVTANTTGILPNCSIECNEPDCFPFDANCTVQCNQPLCGWGVSSASFAIHSLLLTMGVTMGVTMTLVLPWKY
jgi:hypothetical protein